MTRSLRDMTVDPKQQEKAAAISEAAAQYAGKSKAELFEALCEETGRERAAGRLDNTHMDEIYEKLAPMLTHAQREKMREVLRRLKE